MTIWEIFTSMFQNNETDPVKVTATVVLSMPWSILVVVTLGVFLFLTSDGKPSSSGYNVSWQICRGILIYLSLFQRR